MINFLNEIKTTCFIKLREYKLNRFLKKHGCETIEEYNHNFDPDINKGASTVDTFYFNYPYIVKIPNTYALSDFYIGIHILTLWCKHYCKQKWRHDWHRVNTTYQWWDDKYHSEINGIAGEDNIYFAFQSEKDYNWFILSHNF